MCNAWEMKGQPVPARWQPTTVDGQRFLTRKALEEAVRAELARLPRDRPVESPFLAAVVNTFHPEVRSAAQLRRRLARLEG